MTTESKDVMTGTAGTCSICGQSIASATAKHCVACEHKYSRHCPECMEKTKNGWCLKYKYQRHQPPKPKYKFDSRGRSELYTPECTRCESPHPESAGEVQRECPKCHNTRWVFVPPETKAGGEV